VISKDEIQHFGPVPQDGAPGSDPAATRVPRPAPQALRDRAISSGCHVCFPSCQPA
jgi:hypothetical protein